MELCCDPRNGLFLTMMYLTNLALVVQGELTTDDTFIVGYASDTITLPCEHMVAKSNLESVLWRKEGVAIVAEYDKADDPQVNFYGSMVGRASVMVFPSILKFTNGSLEDTGNYQCEVYPLHGTPSSNGYRLTINAKPFNESIHLGGRSYQDCEEVYLTESTEALLPLSCMVSSKPKSRLSWTSSPATTALVVNESLPAVCSTTDNGVVTCEHSATVVTKDLKDAVQVMCVAHFDDRRSITTSSRACVILLPPGYYSPWVLLLVILLVLLLLGLAVVFVIIFLIRRVARKENTSAPMDLRHLAIGLVLVLLLSIIGVSIFIFLTFSWQLLPGKKSTSEKLGVELGEQKGLQATDNENGTQAEDQAKREGEQTDANSREKKSLNTEHPIDPDINTL